MGEPCKHRESWQIEYMRADPGKCPMCLAKRLAMEEKAHIAALSAFEEVSATLSSLEADAWMYKEDSEIFQDQVQALKERLAATRESLSSALATGQEVYERLTLAEAVCRAAADVSKWYDCNSEGLKFQSLEEYNLWLQSIFEALNKALAAWREIQ